MNYLTEGMKRTSWFSETLTTRRRDSRPNLKKEKRHGSCLTFALYVICVFIAYVLLVNCVPSRISYALTNDNPQNCGRPETKLLTKSCSVRGSIIGSLGSYRYFSMLCVPTGSLSQCRVYVLLVQCCVSIHSMQAHWEGARVDSGVPERLNVGLDTNWCLLTERHFDTLHGNTQIGSLYFLNHNRGCACATRSRSCGTSHVGRLIVETATKVFRNAWHTKQTYACTSGMENAPVDAWMLEQRYSMYAPKSIRGGGGSDRFGTHGVKNRDFKSVSTFKEVFVAFMNRTSRILIGNPGDGHCGIHCLQQFLRPFGAMPSYRRTITKGRSEMAQALRNNHDSLLECSYYSSTSADIYLRAGIHEVAMDGEPCTGTYWVENIDLIAWSLETKKRVCVITEDDLVVMVYSGISQPQCIPLADFSPNADDIVMYYVDGVHYETLLHFNEDFVQIEDFLDDFYAENRRGLTSEEHTRFLGRVNAVRDLRNEPSIDLVTLRDALSIWTPCNTVVAQSKTIHGFKSSRGRPPFQPTGLPDNVISLPRITRKVENSVEIPADILLRKYVDLTVTQIPLRQAATPTTYGIQGGQLTSFIIAETVPGSIYIQISRGKHGLASLSLKRFLDAKFVNDASPNAEIVAELGRRQGLHDETKVRFEKQVGNVASPTNSTPHSDVPMVDREVCCESTVEAADEHDAKPLYNPRSVKITRTCDTDDTDENRAQKRPHITTGTKTPNKCPRFDDMNAKHGWPTSTIIGCSNAQNGPSRIEDNTVTSKRQRRTATTTPSCGLNNKKTGGFTDYSNSDSHNAERNFLNVHSNEWSQVQTTWATTNDRNTGDRLPGYDESNNGHLTWRDFARLQTNEMLTDEVMREVAIRITEASPTLAFIPSMILEKFTHCVLTVLDKKLHRGHSKDLWADQ